MAQTPPASTPANLTTHLVLCSAAHLDAFLQTLWPIRLQSFPHSLTVLHYPKMGDRPILQAFNLKAPLP